MAEDLILLQKAEWLERFRAQVQRDYELAGVSAYLPDLDVQGFEALRQSFQRSVQQLEKSNSLKHLLYRIDLTEARIRQAMQQQPAAPLELLLAELMIKRILQKIVLKSLYSNS